MKTTNEIEKQLERKANAYLEQKANEILAIYQQVADFAGSNTSFIDYITHLHQYTEASPEEKSSHVAYADRTNTKKKYKLELELNYKERLVKKYTKELIDKLNIWE